MRVTRSRERSKRREQSETAAASGEDAVASTSRETEGSRIMGEMETGSTTTATGKIEVAASVSGTQRQETVEASDNPVSGERDTSRTVVEREHSRSVSIRSTTSSIRKRRECQARIELAQKELEVAQKELQVAKLHVELAQLDEEDDEIMSEVEAPDDREKCTREWVNTTAGKTTTVDPLMAKESPTNNRLLGAREESSSATDQLAEAIMKAIEIKSTPQCTHPTTSPAPPLPPPPPSYMLELPYFDGNCGEWLAFETVYKQTAPLFSDIINLTRLRKALKGAAREAVKSLLFSMCAPIEVMEALQRRFGRPDAIVLEELEKLRNIPKMSDNMRDICVFASCVNNVVAAIRGLRKVQYLYSPETVKIIVDKIPTVLKSKWFEFLADNREDESPDLTLMNKFLNREADRWGQYTPCESVTKKVIHRQATHSVSHVRVHREEKSNCPYCQEDHRLDNCHKFRQASKEERWNIVKKTRMCFKCLQSRHRRQNCRKPVCKICKRWHHVLLHQDKKAIEKKAEGKEITNNGLQPVNSTRTAAAAYLKMVPVELFGPKGSIKVLALLDEGSTVTLLDSAVAKKIGVQGTGEPLTMETVGGKRITMKESIKANLKIKGLYQAKKRNLVGARTIDGINISAQGVDKKNIEEYSHLRKMVEQLCYEEEKPRLLIGQDNWQLIVSRSTRKGKKNQPVASLTYLGWVLHGSDGGAAKVVNFVTCAHLRTCEENSENFVSDDVEVQIRRPIVDVEEMSMERKNDNAWTPDNNEYQKTRPKNDVESVKDLALEKETYDEKTEFDHSNTEGEIHQTEVDMLKIESVKEENRIICAEFFNVSEKDRKENPTWDRNHRKARAKIKYTLSKIDEINLVLLVPREAEGFRVAKTGVGATHEGEDVGDEDEKKERS